MNEIAIGYWRLISEKDSNDPTLLPWPIENSADDPVQQKAIVDSLQLAFLIGKDVLNYKGWSKCRLCGDHNGSCELQIFDDETMYRIPSGYSHYLTKHNVKGDSRILDLLKHYTA